jgi:Uma2 family endonuclease
MLLSFYELNTPGVEAGIRPTILLGDDSEPQPDLYMRILPENGGRSSTSDDDYIVGPPELIIEIADAPGSIEFGAKRDDYVRHGVLEYVAVSVIDRHLYWFDLAERRELSTGQTGVIHIQSFPGLWIDFEALRESNGNRLMGSIQEGINSNEHTEFVSRLAAAKKPI